MEACPLCLAGKDLRRHSSVGGNAVLLTPERRAKIADVGLARLMPNDYLTAQAVVGTFVWSVSICAPYLPARTHAYATATSAQRSLSLYECSCH